MEDLWPQDIIGEKKLISPAAILKEQGSILGQKTKNIIYGAVLEIGTSGDSFGYIFYISCKVLNYSYKLFSIVYKISLYPVDLTLHDDDILKELGFDPSKTRRIRVSNEKDFKDYLKKIFNTEKSKQVIAGILAHSTE